MIIVNMCNQVDFKELREKLCLTLSQLAELAGCDVLQIVRVEDGKDIPVSDKKQILSVLLQIKEDGINAEIEIWRDRALQAEEKLSLLKKEMVDWIKKI